MTMKFNERVPFSAVFSLRRGLNITRANYQENGVPCLSYGDVHSRYLGLQYILCQKFQQTISIALLSAF